MFKFYAPRFSILLLLLLFFIPATTAWCYLLTEEEADERLREMGLNIDDPMFPVDLLDGFRAMVREMAMSGAAPTSSLSTQSGGMVALSGELDLDEFCAPLPVSFFNANRVWIYELDLPTSPPDSSPVPPLLQYVLGQDPGDPLPLCLPRPALKEHGGTEYLAFTFLRPVWVQGIRYVLESSDDLSDWTQHNDPLIVTETLSPPLDHYQRVWLLDQETASTPARLFLRMRVTHF